MDESKFGAILGSPRMNRCIADGPRLAGGRSAIRQNQHMDADSLRPSCGRSEHIPGHSVTFYTMSSRYFVKSLTLVHEFHHWKELGLRALICFWAMDS